MKYLILIPFFFLVKTGFSQVIIVQANDAQKSQIPTKTIQSSNNSGFLSYNSFTKLTATNDGISAQGNINYSIKPSFSLNLDISTPVTSKTQMVKPLSLSGLSNGSSINFGTQFIKWGSGFEYSQTNYNSAITAVGGDPANFNYDNLTPDQQKIFDRVANISWGKAYFLGAKLGFEQQSFKYTTDFITFTEQEQSELTFKASVQVGILKESGIFALNFTYKEGYQTQDPVKYYIPFGAPGTLIEKNLIPGAPKHYNSEKLRVEFLSSGHKQNSLRLNPNLNIEFSQKLLSFELPVYFLTSDQNKANFNGGVYAGYVSDSNFKLNSNKNNFGFGVFIGANFTNLFQ
jgi:hypothetical protein